MQTEVFGRFAVAHSVGSELTYRLSPSLAHAPEGVIVELPVRNRPAVGVLLGRSDRPKFACIETGMQVPFTMPFSPELLYLINWVSDYYLAPLGRTIHLLAPGFLWDVKSIARRAKRFEKHLQSGSDGSWNIVRQFGASIRGEPGQGNKKSVELRPEQLQALESIFTSEKSVTLLEGITGSGKTEVYLHAAQRVLSEGRTVLVLVPEIALTPQMSSRFRHVFGESLAVLHSGLTPVECEREWFRVHLGQARIVLGVRSAVFAPLRNVGLIIVDEEHDQSYKCDEFPCYHARDVAVKRAQLEKARCILGSATPSLESHYNVSLKRYNHTKLQSRVSGRLPVVEVIDSKKYIAVKQPRRQENSKLPFQSSLIHFEGNIIAEPVVEQLKQVKARGEQSMIILNRRGFANYCLCKMCGNALLCPHCAVTTTLHKHGSQEICHYCGFTRKTLTQCPTCQSNALVGMGAGTQNIETELGLTAPELKVDRLDRDVLTSNTRLSSLLQEFRDGKVDCLIGTQILSKGHDFPRVTLVVILHVEDGLFLPDYRSSERTFALLMQAAGRAGRGEIVGKVVLQSLVVGHPVVDFATAADTSGFLKRELELRNLGWHPPVSRQILFEFKSRSESEALMLGNKVRTELVSHWKNIGLKSDEVRLSGPYPATLEKLRDEFRFHLCVSAQKSIKPSVLVPKALLESKDLQRKVRCDVDPFSFL